MWVVRLGKFRRILMTTLDIDDGERGGWITLRDPG